MQLKPHFCKYSYVILVVEFCYFYISYADVQKLMLKQVCNKATINMDAILLKQKTKQNIFKTHDKTTVNVFCISGANTA